MPLLRGHIVDIAESTPDPIRFLQLVAAGYDRYMAGAVMGAEQRLAALIAAECAVDQSERAGVHAAAERTQTSLDMMAWRLETYGFDLSPAEKRAWDALDWLERIHRKEGRPVPTAKLGPVSLRAQPDRAPIALSSTPVHQGDGHGLPNTPKTGTRKPNRRRNGGNPRQNMAGHCHGLGRQFQSRTGRKWDESEKGARDGYRHEQVLAASKGRTDAVNDLDLQELGRLAYQIEQAIEQAKRGAPQAELSVQAPGVPAAETTAGALRRAA